MKHLFYIGMVIGTMAMSLVSCTETEIDTTGADVARVTAFGFADNDSIPALGEAVFVIQELSDTGLIEIKDSLEYGTPLDSVTPSISFYYTPYAAILTTPFDTLSYSGSVEDTINMSADPMTLTVYSYDKSNVKIYRIKAYAHQVDPYLFHWTCTSNKVGMQQPCSQRTILSGDTLYYFANTGFATKLYCSLDAVSWTEQDVVGLPTDCQVQQIVSDEGMFYYGDSLNMYTSSNGVQWTSHSYVLDSLSPIKTTMAFNGNVWVISCNARNQYLLTYWEDNQLKPLLNGTKVDTLPSSFPISDFAVVQFESTSGHTHTMVAGGYNRYGRMVNCRWNIEYNRSIGQYRMVDYAQEQPQLEAFAGASIVSYDDKLYMFGGVDENQQFLPDIRYSTDEGLHWLAVDTSKNQLPSEYYAPRYNVSTLVKNNNIYLIGGKSHTQTFTDAYRGRINSIDFIRK